jgi:hypothetical protein
VHSCPSQKNFPAFGMHENRETLELSLKSQVLHEVENALSNVRGKLRIHAASQVVEYLCSREDENFVELSVNFMESLIRYMIGYVNELVIDSVSSVLQSQNESVKRTCKYSAELSICDELLRSLRQLQTDMSHRISINEGNYKPPDTLNRSHKLPRSRFDDLATDHIDKIVERSILTRSCGSGYHMAQALPHVSNTGHVIRERARLISYLFLCSQQLDAFFIGIDLLRQTGQHVAQVLTSIFVNTSIKFVRDRIWTHLSHKQSSQSALWGIVPLLRKFEELYPINCFDTQLNRRWSMIEGFVVGEGSDKALSPPPKVDCGNIPDVAPELLGDQVNIGNIGNLSLDEANNILRCMHCSAEPFPNNHITSSGDGYMHMTVSWLRRMTEKDIKMIFLERGAADGQTGDGSNITIEDQFLFYTNKHDWYSILQLLEDNPEFFIQCESTIVKSIEEKLFLHCPLNANVSPQMLATVGLFLSGESSPSVVISQHHDKNLEWIMSSSSGIPPQVLPLYLRRYGLWEAEDSVSNMKIENDIHKIQLYGRLGISELPYVSRLMMASGQAKYDADLVRLCEYMFEGVSDADESSVLDWIQTTFPELEQFLKSSPQSNGVEKIEGSIYDLKTQIGDVSIKDLLVDVYPEWDKRSNQCKNIDIVEKTDFSLEYLLAQGRPCRAFLLGEKSGLQKSARRVAFYNLFDDGVVACSIAFLDLNGESTESLRVDIQSARSILGQNYSRQRRDEVVNVFLSFANNGKQSENLLRALKMLEEAAWIQEPPTGAGGGEVAPAGESPWHLVALFCRVHNLPRSLTLLHELARNGDWVMFLHESDLQQCPIDTVRDVVRLYFADNPLRSHLNILLGGGETVSEESQLRNVFRGSDFKQTANSTRNDQLQKFLSLYQFERARRFVEDTVDREEMLTVLHNWKSNGSFLLESEINNLTRIASLGMNDSSSSLSTPIAADDDIGSLDASSFKGTMRTSSSSSGVMVESLLTDDEDEALLLDSIRQALSEGSGAIDTVRDKVTEEGIFRQMYMLFVNHLSRERVVSEDAFLGLARIVSLEVRESFGHFLINKLKVTDGSSPELDPIEVRRDVCILTYYAMTTSFSDSGFDDLNEYIMNDDRIGSVKEEVGTHIAEKRWGESGNDSEITNSAHKLLEMSSKRVHGDSKVSLIDLHCLTKVAGVFKHHGMLRRHLAATELIHSVSSRLKSSVLD